MDALSPEALLEVLASRRKGRRIKAVDMNDPFVCSTPSDWRDALASKPPPDRLRFEIRLRVLGLPFVLRANDAFIAIEVKGSFAEPLFSINRPNRMLDISHLASTRTVRPLWPVFVSSDQAKPIVLTDPAIWDVLERLHLSKNESLHVYNNGVATYVQPRTTQRLDVLLETLATFIRRLPADNPAEVDLTDLPERFRPLIPLIRKWAKSDDLEREEQIERASTNRLKVLIRALEPEFPAINNCLDGFEASPPDWATALGTLAECAVEAKAYLESVNSQKKR